MIKNAKGTKQVNVELRPDIAAASRQFAKTQKIYLSGLVDRALHEYLTKRGIELPPIDP